MTCTGLKRRLVDDASLQFCLAVRRHLREFGHPVAQGLAAIVLRGECPASGGEMPWRMLALRMTLLGSWFGEK